MLDALRRRDGRTLGQLAEPMPMTRYGVMKHLALLEEAGLVTTERVGRGTGAFLVGTSRGGDPRSLATTRGTAVASGRLR
jgi:DNA-binding transcriptional ArsR family regulator